MGNLYQRKKKPPTVVARLGRRFDLAFCCFVNREIHQIPVSTVTRGHGFHFVREHRVVFLRKEVIQPQVPLRLPCYDFTPVADPTVVGCLLLPG